MIEVIVPGLVSSVQDLGRQGYMHMGVSRSGALDRFSMQIANRLLENDGNAAVIEIIMPPAEFVFHQDCWIAMAGSPCKVMIDDTPVWFGWRVPIKKGQRLKIMPTRLGFSCYLAVSGGIDVESLMGSRAADLKAGFGGYDQDGAALKKGDMLKVGPTEKTLEHILGIRLPHWNNYIRVIDGPEYDQFSAKAHRYFFSTDWRIDSNSNRMGFRLQGLELTREVQDDILSQGVFPGVIQVPPNGQPIILAAEAQSTGGYPRIGVIIQADFWKMGQARIGQYLRFKRCSIEEAKQALWQRRTYLNKIDYVISASKE